MMPPPPCISLFQSLFFLEFSCKIRCVSEQRAWMETQQTFAFSPSCPFAQSSVCRLCQTPVEPPHSPAQSKRLLSALGLLTDGHGSPWCAPKMEEYMIELISIFISPLQDRIQLSCFTKSIDRSQQ
ncbi:hypothetical protein FQA47_010067 [Oryzias melastigma]|uniref:Uncharacterized protein n=1 Tax=Oryzias melastigma TaxID=30732 RepID=A0A834KWW0_ORYME|nr:hypothetical protein FQA47_010067 [Oryzias melastigma]